MKRQRGERTKSLVLAVALVLSFILYSPALADTTTQTFQKDLDWSVWTKQNIEAVGSDSGVRLATDPATKGYYTSGTITYKFSPGGINRWQNSASDITAVSTSDTGYTWMSHDWMNKVMQTDPVDGSLVRDWVTNTTALAGAPGISADYWVSNLSPYDSTTSSYRCNAADQASELCYSVSHIIPAQNKIVTRAIPSVTSRNLVTMSMDAVGHKLWIGDATNKQVIVLNIDSFDDKTIPLDYETIATTYIPHRSAYSQTAQAFCFTSFKVGVECISATASHTRFTIAESYANDMKVDENGDFWYSGAKYYKIHPVFSGGTYNLLSQNFDLIEAMDGFHNESSYGHNQILIIPNSIDPNPADLRDVFLWNNQTTEDVWYRQLDNRALPGVSTLNSSSGGKIDEHFSYMNRSDGSINSRMNVNANGDIYFVGVALNKKIIGLLSGTEGCLPYSISAMSCYTPLYRFFDNIAKNSGSYQTSSEFYDSSIGTTALTKFRYFENFIGPSVGANDTGVKIEYSTDNASWVQAANDGSISLNDSPDLYIKATLTSRRSSSPILKSLKITYMSSLGENLKTMIDKGLYKSAADRDNGGVPVSTFESGEKVYARIKITEPTQRRDNVTIEDVATGVKDFTDVNGKHFKYKTGSSGVCSSEISAFSGILPSAVSPTYSFIFPYISSGLTCIDYDYTFE